MIYTADFEYDLSPELIAQEPAKERDHSRLMVIDRLNQVIQHKHFYDIANYLQAGDALVLNDTKVIPGRLIGKKEAGGAKIEVLLIKEMEPGAKTQIWKCLVRPGKRLAVGSRILFPKGVLSGTVMAKLPGGEQLIEFESKVDFWYIISKLGNIPLPPYIKSPKGQETKTKQNPNPQAQLFNRYQTVYAKKDGASAAPTAGLHFTPQLLEQLTLKGVRLAYITLHTGLATFNPVRSEQVEDHQMQAEYCEIPAETLGILQEARRIVAVGTTTVRALESRDKLRQDSSGNYSGETDLFIYPGYEFKNVNAMVTNFHWPRSSLIMLVSAFAQQMLAGKSIFSGRDFIMHAYQAAIKKKYRFYSFGDAMFIH